MFFSTLSQFVPNLEHKLHWTWCHVCSFQHYVKIIILHLKCMPVPETRKSQQSLPQRICTPKVQSGETRLVTVTSISASCLGDSSDASVDWTDSTSLSRYLWLSASHFWGEHQPVHPDWLAGPLSAEWHGMRHPMHAQWGWGQANKVARATAQLLHLAGNPASCRKSCKRRARWAGALSCWNRKFAQGSISVSISCL